MTITWLMQCTCADPQAGCNEESKAAAKADHRFCVDQHMHNEAMGVIMGWPGRRLGNRQQRRLRAMHNLPEWAMWGDLRLMQSLVRRGLVKMHRDLNLWRLTDHGHRVAKLLVDERDRDEAFK